MEPFRCFFSRLLTSGLASMCSAVCQIFPTSPEFVLFCLLGVRGRGCWCCWSVLSGPLSSALNGAPLLSHSSVARLDSAARRRSIHWLHTRCTGKLLRSCLPCLRLITGGLLRLARGSEIATLLLFIPRAYFCLSSVRRHNKLPLSVTVLWLICSWVFGLVNFFFFFFLIFEFVCFLSLNECSNLHVFSCVGFVFSVLDYFALIECLNIFH